MTDHLLQATNINLRFGARSVLTDVNLTVHNREIVTLIGPNGAGKTSLVRILLGLMQPTSGAITRKPKLTIGYMPQKIHIESSLPLNVKRFLTLTGCSSIAAASALETTGIPSLLNAPLQTLSGGEMQRVLLARALLRKPDLLVLDEPVQGVDVVGQAELYQLISDIRSQQNCGVLMVSHDLHLVMAATDTVICLNQHVCCHGRPENVTNHPAYLALFGRNTPPAVAMYTHNHNHEHDIHGNVLAPHDCKDHKHA